MRLSKLIKYLKGYEKKKGNVMLMEFKIIFPEGGNHSYLNSVKDDTKKMTVKEYVKLQKEGFFDEF